MGLLRQPDGSIVSVPDEEVGHAVATGATPVSEQEAGATTGAYQPEDRGVVGSINAAATSALSGITAGGSDLLLSSLLDKGGARRIAEDRAANPITSTVSNIAGAALPAMFGDVGSLTPSGQIGNIGKRIAAFGEGSGLVGRTAANVGAGAAEGSLFNAGNYLAQSALEDKPLSAEGFVGAMGEGAMWGGGLSGALSLGGEALQRARSLFPQHEVTAAAAKQIDRQATEKLSAAIDDGAAMEQTAQQKLEQYRAEQRSMRLQSEKDISDLKIAQEQAKLDKAQAQADLAKTKAEYAKKPLKAFYGDQPIPGEDVKLPGTPIPPDSLGGLEQYRVPNEAPTPDMTWREFTKGKMGEYMKSEGGHAGAMKRLGEEWKAYKAGAPIGDAGIEAPTATGHPAGDDLLGRLQATKNALDAGTPLGELSNNPQGQKLAQATQEFQAAKSELDAWMQKYQGGEVGKFERSQAARDYAAGIRPKEAGYYTRTPEGEGSTLLPRGRTSVFRGSEAERAAADAQTLSRLKPEERLAADTAVEQMFGRSRGPADIAADIAHAPAAPVNPEEAINAALTKHVGEHVDLAPDINEAARVIGTYEEKSAALADALGPDAPPTAQQHAAEFNAAKAKASEAQAKNVANASDTIDTKLKPSVLQTNKGSLAPLASKLGDAAGVLELLGHLGHFVHGIPVVGPVLSMFLKAKAIMGVTKRLGGSIGPTAETVIAAKAAATRNRVNAAISHMLDTSSKAMVKAAPTVGGATTPLAHQLFPGGKGGGKTAQEQYRARTDEIARAMQPDAIRREVTDRVRTSDPDLLANIVDTKTRGLQYLNSIWPKAPVVPSLLKGDGKPWQPTPQQLDSLSRSIKAVDDPASVFEHLAQGQVSMEEAKALKAVYPALFSEAQQLLVSQATKLDNTLPLYRRAMLSVLFGVPVDNIMSPSHIQYLSQSSGVQSNQSPPQAPATQPPTPGITGPVNVGQRAMTSLDRRAGA